MPGENLNPGKVDSPQLVAVQPLTNFYRSQIESGGVYCVDSTDLSIKGFYAENADSKTSSVIFDKCYGPDCASKEEFKMWMKGMLLRVWSISPYFDFKAFDDPIKYKIDELYFGNPEFYLDDTFDGHIDFD